MIYRAISYSTDRAWLERDGDERVVFSVASSPEEASRSIKAGLAEMWRVPAEAVELYNLDSEAELFDKALAAAESGDLTLLEVGSSGGHPVYLSREPILLQRTPEDRVLSALSALRTGRTTGFAG